MIKKKEIVFSIIGIILISAILLIITSNNTKKTFIKDGVIFAVKKDGVSQNNFPTGSNYYVNIDCTNARGRWMKVPSTNGGNDSDYRLVIDNITGKVECNVDFQTITTSNTTDTHFLNNMVLANATDETNNHGPNYNSTTIVTDLSPTYWYGPHSSTSGTEGSYWTYSNGIFTSQPSNFNTTNRDYYHAYAKVKENGYYQICYNIAQATSTNDKFYIAVGSSYKTSINASTSSSTSGCYTLGYLTTNKYINISQYGYSYASSPEITFTLEKAAGSIVNVGYRYQGKKPNNYIWYNNEMWRIIGLIPTCLTSTCGNNTTNLVKIIRAESLGGYAWNASSNKIWDSSNSLYQVLNNYYLTNGDATNNSICQGTASANCDYRVKGIGSNTYYYNMIEDVYWNTGMSADNITAPEIYSDEIGTRTVQGKIGIMNASDYGYATTTHTDSLSSYSSYTSTKWLYGKGNEWTLNAYSTGDGEVLYVYTSGNVSRNHVNYDSTVRPVLYLKDSVYVVSGNGTEANPYQIAMSS